MNQHTDRNTIQHPLWGIEFTKPEGWLHRVALDAVFFADHPEGLQHMLDTPPPAAQLLVMAEWNGLCLPLESSWQRHIQVLKDGFSAKAVRDAPWQISKAQGFEAELDLPKQDSTRMWTGILTRDLVVLQFVLSHHTKDTEALNPIMTELVSSLCFIDHVEGIERNQAGIPLPPGYTAADPRKIIPDIEDPQNWEAYSSAAGGGASVGALQAFYQRELASSGWLVTEYIPYPGQDAISFARFSIRDQDRKVIIGILPPDDEQVSLQTARVIIRY